MAEYIAVTSLSLQPNPDKPLKTRVVKAGETVELSDTDAERLLELKAIKRPDGEQEAGGSDAGVAEAPQRTEVELPERPSNGATKEAWRTYLGQLAVATDEDMEEPLDVPADATRDQMIQIGDARVAEWNEE